MFVCFFKIQNVNYYNFTSNDMLMHTFISFEYIKMIYFYMFVLLFYMHGCVSYKMITGYTEFFIDDWKALIPYTWYQIVIRHYLVRNIYRFPPFLRFWYLNWQGKYKNRFSWQVKWKSFKKSRNSDSRTIAYLIMCFIINQNFTEVKNQQELLLWCYLSIMTSNMIW